MLDLFVFTLPVSAGASGSIEGDVVLKGSPEKGYRLLLHPTDMDVDAWINGVPDWLCDIIIWIAADGLVDIPDIELNLGTQLAPGLSSVTPNLTTNDRRTALILEWTLDDLGGSDIKSPENQVR